MGRPNIDFDSDQQIMGHTVVKDGKWFFYNPRDNSVMAEAVAPAKPDRATIETWCGAVRGKWNARNEINTEEVLARKKARREGYDSRRDDNSGDSVRDDDIPADVHRTDDVQTEAVRAVTFDEDPELYALEQVKLLSERQTVLEQELETVIKSRRKWDAIAAAAQQAGDEDV